MRITDFSINGFGIFHDVSVENLPEGLILFQGDNEAGKSTCLGFFYHILFGFPDKRTSEKRFPPLYGGRHGGSLTLQTETEGQVTITRGSGPRGGNVQLTYQDGTLGSGADAEQLLGGITRELFRNVYAFSLQEMQNLDSLTDERIAAAMFTAGSGTGLSSYPNAVEYLRKGEEDRFKPQGQKQRLNCLLQELEQVEEQLKTAHGTVGEYTEKHTELQRLESEIADFQSTVEESRKSSAYLKNCLDVWEMWEELCAKEKEKAALPMIVHDFPEDGVTRLEKLQERKTEAEKRQQDSEDKIHSLLAEGRKWKMDKAFLRNGDAIRQVCDRRHRFSELLHKLEDYEQNLSETERKIKEHQETLGADWTEDEIRQTDVSVVKKERLYDLRNRKDTCHTELEKAREAYDTQKEALSKSHQQADRIASELQKAEEELSAYDEDVMREISEVKERFQSLSAEQKSVAERAMQTRKELQDTLRDIGPEWDEKTLDACDISGSLRQTIEEYRRNFHEITQQLNEPRNRRDAAASVLKTTQERLEGREEKLKNLEKPPFNTEQEAYERRNTIRKLQRLAEEIQTAEKALTATKNMKETLYNRISSLGWTFIALLLMGALLFGTGVIMHPGTWLPGLGIVSVAAAAASYGVRRYAALKAKEKENDIADKENLIEEKNQHIARIQEELGLSSEDPLTPETFDWLESEVDRMLTLFQKKASLEEECESLRQDKETTEREYEQADREVQKQQEACKELQGKWEQFVKSIGSVDISLSPESLMELLPRIQRAKDLKQHLSQIEDKLEEQKQEKADIYKLFQKLDSHEINSKLEEEDDESVLRSLDKMLADWEQRKTDYTQKQREQDDIQKRIQESEQDTEKANERLKKALTQMEEIDRGWKNLLREFGLDENLTPQTAIDAVNTIADCRDSIQSKEALLKGRDECSHETEALREKAQQVLEAVQWQIPPDSELTTTLQRLAEQEEQIRQSFDARQKMAQDIREERRKRYAAFSEQRQYDRTIQELLEEAEVETEEQFRKKAACYEQQQALEARIRDLEERIRIGTGTEDIHTVRTYLASVTCAELQQKYAVAKQEQDEKEKTLEQKRQERAEIRQELSALASSEDITNLKNTREQLRTDLQEGATEWARFAVARTLLEEARARFEEEQQPEVIRRASTYFEKMTGGEYTKVFAPLSERTVRVQTKEGTLKEPPQLSRGTAEQLYLALRFGYISHNHKQRQSPPVVMDEVLVNFDPQRAKQAAEAVCDLANEQHRQILYFTCHPENIELFREINGNIPVYTVSNGNICPA